MSACYGFASFTELALQDGGWTFRPTLRWETPPNLLQPSCSGWLLDMECVRESCDHILFSGLSPLPQRSLPSAPPIFSERFSCYYRTTVCVFQPGLCLCACVFVAFFFFCVICMYACFLAPKYGRCLKLYCDCFASSRYCGIACLCKECCNRPDAEVLQEARR